MTKMLGDNAIIGQHNGVESDSINKRENRITGTEVQSPGGNQWDLNGKGKQQNQMLQKI